MLPATQTQVTPTVAGMTASQKVAEALRRSLPLLPADARAEVEKLLEPATLAILVGVLVVWAGSHFFGVGEVVDVVLLAVGVAFLGMAAWEAGNELVSFANTAVNATSSADLDRAAHSFARAVSIIGINAVMAVLFHQTAKAVRARPSRTSRPGLIEVGPPPPKGKVRIVEDPTLAPGEGFTTAYGDITVSSRGSANDKALVLYHEMVHSFLSPKLAPLRELRARLSTSAYVRSALLKYLEEALAETYAQLRVNGISELPTGIRFPVKNGYVTISQLRVEGTAIGTIVIGTMSFNVTYVPGGPSTPQ
jgi:hypothetical protein